MSSTVFEDRYRLMKCVAVAGGIRTHHAQERATGRIVMVHVQDEVETGAQQHFQSAVERCPPPHNARILETAMLPSGGFAVVTDFLQGFTSFRDWLAFRVPGAFPGTAAGQTGVIAAAGGASAAEMPTADASGQNPSDDGTNALDANAMPRHATVQRSAVTTQQAEDDSATQIISAVSAAPPTASTPATEPLATMPVAPEARIAPPPAPKQPGEFTRMFGQVSTPTPPTAQTPAHVPPTLSTPQLPATPSASPPAPPSKALFPPDSLAPGEFTRMFNAPTVPPSREGASPFGAPPSAPAVGVGAARPPAAPSFPSSPRSGGSATHSFDAPGTPGGRSPDYSAGQGLGGAPDALAAFGAGSAAPPERPTSSSHATDERRGLGDQLPAESPESPPAGDSPASMLASNLSNLSNLSSFGSNFSSPPAAPSLPPLPSLPSTPGFSSAPALPVLPAAPAIPSMPAPPALPAMPLPAMPQLPSLPPLGGGSPFGGASAPPMRLSPVGTPAPAAASGGEYTRIIKAGVTPPPPAPAPVAAPVAAPARQRTVPLGLIITLFVVLLLAAVLVLYFAFRPAPATATRGTLPAVPTLPGASAPGAASTAPAATPAPGAATPVTPATPAPTP